MSEAQGVDLNGPGDEARRGLGIVEAQPRAVGSPLPVGSGRRPALPIGAADPRRAKEGPASGRALANSAAAPPPGGPSGMQRFVSAIRATLPLVQRILPLLDGNIGTAVSNVLAPHHAPTPPAPPPVNLAPITECLAELQTQHSELRDQVVEQNASLKRVEDRLEMVRDATDRNTLEQQELMEDLKAVGRRVSTVAIIAIVLLAASLALNVLLYLHVRRVLP
jgi:hypothetical protein